MIGNEEHCLDVAPGQHRIPENIICDIHVEKLSIAVITMGADKAKKGKL